ncbi:MAG: glycosyltransferase [Chloroflexi bacterium]|nr:glycosyltransferase [Chloroflexota bacterium]
MSVAGETGEVHRVTAADDRRWLRILFASVAADGHFNPLTGIAVHLRDAGHDVRWYTGAAYAARLEELRIPHFAFRRAREINAHTIPELFPERARLKGPALIRFDFEYVFVNNTALYFDDVREIDAVFPLDILIADGAWMAARLVRDVLHKHVIGIGLGTLLAPSPEVPPNFAGLRPARTPVGRLVHRVMGAAMDRIVVANGRRLYNQVLAGHGLPPIAGSVFEEFYSYHHVLFQNGVPGFEYPRRPLPPKLRFVGLLGPVRTGSAARPPQLDSVRADQRIVLISQGTMDNDDPQKLIVPALEALAPTGALLIIGTGHKHTAALRSRFRQPNVVIEDYIDFESVLERADVFISNGGHGSVLLSLSKGVPIVGAGVREGKNDINARVEHFHVGVNLHTEKPRAAQIARAVDRLLTHPTFRQRADELRLELARYRPLEIIDQYLEHEVTLPASRR